MSFPRNSDVSRHLARKPKHIPDVENLARRAVLTVEEPTLLNPDMIPLKVPAQNRNDDERVNGGSL